MASSAVHCPGLPRPQPPVGRPIRRRVPIDWQWARAAPYTLPDRRGSGIFAERPRPWAQLAGRLLCPSYSLSTLP